MALVKNMSISAVLLGLFAVMGTGMVAWTHHNTAEQIAYNERAYLLRNLHTLVPPDSHDNDLFHDTISVEDKKLLGSNKPVTIYRARQRGEPVAAIINSVAPDGYNGEIKLLVAIRYNGELAGVRIVSHRETPGLGDAIDAERSDWILDFSGKSLANPPEKDWAVKRDGGEFDQFTGATITPRAVVKAVYNTLKYYQQNRLQIFTQSSNLTQEPA